MLKKGTHTILRPSRSATGKNCDSDHVCKSSTSKIPASANSDSYNCKPIPRIHHQDSNGFDSSDDDNDDFEHDNRNYLPMQDDSSGTVVRPGSSMSRNTLQVPGIVTTESKRNVESPLYHVKGQEILGLRMVLVGSCEHFWF